MATVVLESPLLPLAFVGCWNRKIIGVAPSPRDLVAARIREDIAAKGIRTVILGGDNEYPPSTIDETTGQEVKGNKPKSANAAGREAYLKAFEEGAALYSGIPQLYVAVGNHNIDEAGRIFEHQRAAFGTSMLNNYYKIVGDTHDVVVIDTNLVGPGREAEYAEMLMWLRAEVAGPKPYLLVQHEPFAAFSKLTDKGVKKKAVLNNSVGILEAVKEHPPIAILCADTHNYQEGVIVYGDLRIPQYVVGTGGAMPDKMFEVAAGEEIFTRADMPYTYEFRRMIPNYGYLRIDPGPTFLFEEVTGWRGGARKQKTRRRRAPVARRTKSRHRVRG